MYMYCANYEFFCQNILLCGQCLRIFFWNLAILFSNSSLGSEKLKQNRRSLIKSKFTDLNHMFWSLPNYDCVTKVEGIRAVRVGGRYIVYTKHDPPLHQSINRGLQITGVFSRHDLYVRFCSSPLNIETPDLIRPTWRGPDHNRPMGVTSGAFSLGGNLRYAV